MGISYSPPASNKLRDDSGVLALDGNARQALDPDGGVSADWNTSDQLTVAPIKFRDGGVLIKGSGVVSTNGEAVVVSNSTALGNGDNTFVFGNEAWAFRHYSLVLSSGFAGGKYSSVIGGDGGATHPVTRANCADTVFTAITDEIWGSAAAFDAHVRIGDIVYLQPLFGDHSLVGSGIVTAVTASTLTVDSAPATGDGQYDVFVSGAGDYGQQIYSNPPFDAGGDAQRSKWLPSNTTTDATPTRLILGDKDSPGAANGQNQIRIFKGQARFFTIKVLGLKDNITAFGGIYKGLISNPSGTTALVGSVTSEEWKDTAASAWAVAVTADASDSIGELAITVTGAAATNIRWMGLVDSTEVAWFPAAA